MAGETLVRWLVLACALGGATCGGWVPEPTLGERPPREKPVVVPRAPPPARVELIPARPTEPPDTVWIDGEYVWRGRRWEWKPGRWEVPPDGASYLPPEIVYLPEDRVGWFAGRWKAPAEAPR